MSSTYPLVSCIMPTANRERFIPQAIQYFLRQDYPNKELVIVDDGQNSIETLIPADNSIRYTRLDKTLTTGAKRNHACEFSKGEIIVHWDDDDWYAGNWLSHQVSTLQATNADICGLSGLLFYDPLHNKAWKYAYPAHERPWVAGATMAYKKSFWQAHPFKDLKIGEDNMFAWDDHPKVVAHNFVEGVVAMIHPKNTSPKTATGSRWRPVPVSVVENILKGDIKFYTAERIK